MRRRSYATYSKLGQDLLTNLPLETSIDILSRLSLRTTLLCKRVCKSWRSLIETPEFAEINKLARPLAIFQEENMISKLPYKVCELVDDDGKCCINEVFNFSFPHPAPLHSSVDGFLLLFNQSLWAAIRHNNLMICNPITRDYIKIPPPHVDNTPELLSWPIIIGFGVSKTTVQYKLVRIFCTYNVHQWMLKNDSYSCQVYTLGSGGLWRSVALTSSSIVYKSNMVGVFSNGNIHWLASDLNGFLRISCFDLETELFTTPLSPPPHLKDSHVLKNFYTLSSALSGCLVLCDNSSLNEIVIWWMKDYGDDKSWTKQYVISKINSLDCLYGPTMYVIGVLKDGDVWIESGNSRMLCYSNKTRSIRETGLIESRGHFSAGAFYYTPSFLPLKTLFPMENVSSF